MSQAEGALGVNRHRWEITEYVNRLESGLEVGKIGVQCI